MDNSKVSQLHAQIGQWLLTGILISVVIVTMGGVYSLSLYGYDSVYQQAFYSQKPEPGTLSDILESAYQLTSAGIIQLGVFMLVAIQLLRVILVGWYFIKLRDSIFIAISAVILVVMIYSLFWRFVGF